VVNWGSGDLDFDGGAVNITAGLLNPAGGVTDSTLEAADIGDQNAGTDITADLEEESHCAEHASTDVSCSGETLLVTDDQHNHTTTTISGLVDADMSNDALDADKIIGDSTDDDDLDVAAGGTGVSTILANAAIYGNGSGDILTTAAHTTNGSLLIGDGAGVPTVAIPTGGANTTVTAGAGSLEVSADYGFMTGGASLISVTGVFYMPFSGGLANTSSAVATNQIVTTGCDVRDVCLAVFTAPGGTHGWVAEFIDNGAIGNNDCTISGASTGCCDTTETDTITAQHTAGWRMTPTSQTGIANPGGVLWTSECLPP
jgi:hypothetical protein